VVVKRRFETANNEIESRVNNKLEQVNLVVDDLTSKVIEQGTDMDTNFKEVESKIVRMDKEINNVKEVLVEVQETAKKDKVESLQLIEQRVNQEKLKPKAGLKR
jgi:hypothetical protein